MADGSRGPSNGTTRERIGGLAAAGGVPYDDDPLSKVLGLDPHSSSVVAWLGYTLGAIAVLLGTSVLVRAVGLLVALTNQLPQTNYVPQEIEVEEAPPPPPAEPPPEPKQDVAPAPRPTPHEAPPPPPAAPAQAAKVLTQEPDPNEPVDLTGNTIITGNGDVYAGGTTTANGTSKTAVRGTPAPTGVPGGTGPVAAAPVHKGDDHSRRASLGGGNDWSCPFPQEADVAQIDDAYVTLDIDVQPDGTAKAVRVLSDPGNGFGREAYRCAMARRGYVTALDYDGNAIPGQARVRVHFSR